MRKLTVCISALAVFAFSSCSDDGGGTSNFGSQSEADAAVAQSQSQINLAISDVQNVSSTARNWGLTKPHAYTYDAGTGWWSWTYSSSSSGYTYNYDYRHRFTPRDENGNATNATTKMEYKYDYSYTGSAAGNTYDLSYLSDITCDNVSAYRAGTGNLTVNGSSGIDYDFDFSAGPTNYSYEYSYNNKYTNVAFDRNETYPVSGSISFTSKFKLTPSNPYVNNYNVAGKITFTGGNTATLEFGGYTYSINLQTGAITSAS